MKRLALIIIAAGLAWSGYWVWASSQKRAAVEAWLTARQEEGWQVDYDALSVSGFPNRVDLTLTDLILADRAAGLTWETDFFQILTLSYKPGHEILVFAPENRITYRGESYRITSDGLRASVLHEGPLITDLRAEAEVLNIETPKRSLALAGLTAGMLRSGQARYTTSLLVQSLARSDRMVTGSAAPETVDLVRFNAEWAFDTDWRIDSAPQARPQPTQLKLSLAEYAYGLLTLKLAGRTDIDALGRLTGEITVKAENWRDLLEAARQGGYLPETVSDGLEDGLGIVAQLSGNRETLDLPLSFRQGQMSLGPIPLGEGPRLRLP